ncbi:MAG: glycosyltransferase family 1 protein [Anaerolineae bacterium]|nr:glycosyltransferase family 1 protein [Anaerolineae bacterium]
MPAKRLTILAIGSRGDVQPYVALGIGLQRAGYAVTLVAGDDFEPFITGYGLGFHPLGVNIGWYIEEKLYGAMGTGRNSPRALREIVRTGLEFAPRMITNLRDACADADAILAHIIGALMTFHLAEKWHKSFLLTLSFPLPGRTREVPNATLPFGDPLDGSTPGPLRSRVNLFTHQLTEALLWGMIWGPANHWRGQEGLPPLPLWRWPLDRLNGASRPIPAVYGYSPLVLPHPADWGPHQHVCGYWTLPLPADWQPPADLAAFLAAGPPPVFVGFGSMSARAPLETARIALDAVRRSGLRGIVQPYRPALEEVRALAGDDPNIFVLGSCPHEWLFPRMVAVAHHGGVGTTAAALRAGHPAVVVPFFGDQPFWAGRVRALGTATEPIPRQALTSERLAYALRVAATHQPMRQRAEALGEKIRGEDGVSEAVRVINNYLRG